MAIPARLYITKRTNHIIDMSSHAHTTKDSPFNRQQTANMSILPSHTPKVTDPLLGANQEQEDDETMIRSGTLRKTLIRLVACGIVIFGFIYLPATSSSIHLPIPWTGNPPAPVKEPVLVPLEAHIISKCPDTRVSWQACNTFADANIAIGLSQVDGFTNDAKGDG